MGRAPCCEKMGLKRGPWTKEEDDVLVAYINQFGHENWRALPKRAGLLRCGKSCRLRWTNYLRLDIKRGNFTKDEEDTIIHLHHALGNRWSKIAAKLPGRTDNEIKNVWHTHLKKRLKKPDVHQENNNNHKNPTSDDPVRRQVDCSPATTTTDQFRLNSPLQSSSSDVTSITLDGFSPLLADDVLENYLKLDDGFWSFENSTGGGDFGYGFNSTSLNLDDDMKFWSDLFHFTAEETPELPDSLSPSSSDRDPLP